MEAWLNIVLRQAILYSLPVIVSLGLIAWLESRLFRRELPHPFYSLGSRLTWWPLLASLALHRGIIIAPPRPVAFGLRAAALRLAMHLLLALIGLGLFALSLGHRSPSGLPPLHHWWAKVLMFYNLCMAAMHLLPLPHQLAGEWLTHRPWCARIAPLLNERNTVILLTLLAASPLLDAVLGGAVVFPIYESISALAHHLSD